MRWLVVLLVCFGCGDDDGGADGGTDAPSMDAPVSMDAPISMDALISMDAPAPVACGELSCGVGELCVPQYTCCRGFDAGPDVEPCVIDHYECVPIPSGCAELGCGCFDTDPCEAGSCTRIETERRLFCGCA